VRLRGWLHRRPALRAGYRTAVAAAGVTIIAAGIVMLPFPGPGWLTIFLGLGVLASEFGWAGRLLHFARRWVEVWWHWVGGQSLVVRGVITVLGLGFIGGVLLVTIRLVGAPTWVTNWLPLLG
jgi:uncharacterized protein (TIGR02611 family)